MLAGLMMSQQVMEKRDKAKAKEALDKIKVPAEGAKDALIASAKKSPESLRKKIERLDISVSQKMEKAGVELTDRKIKFNDDINVTDAIEAAKKNRKHEPSHLADDLAIQGKLSKDTELVRVHGVLTDNEKGAKPSGAWWTHPDVIKGKSPKEIKDVLGLEHEPKYISRVQFKEGTEVLVSNVEKAWGTKGGGIQFKLNVKGEDLEGFIGKQNKIHGPLPLK